MMNKKIIGAIVGVTVVAVIVGSTVYMHTNDNISIIDSPPSIVDTVDTTDQVNTVTPVDPSFQTDQNTENKENNSIENRDNYDDVGNGKMIPVPPIDNREVENVVITDENVSAVVGGEAFGADIPEKDTRTTDEKIVDLGREMGLPDDMIEGILGCEIPDSRKATPNDKTPEVIPPVQEDKENDSTNISDNTGDIKNQHQNQHTNDNTTASPEGNNDTEYLPGTDMKIWTPPEGFVSPYSGNVPDNGEVRVAPGEGDGTVHPNDEDIHFE